jgi:hypothetical protein
VTTQTPVVLHEWSKVTVVPVDVIVDPFTGVPLVVEWPGMPVGEQVGCGVCGEPLTAASSSAPCMVSIEEVSLP